MCAWGGPTDLGVCEQALLHDARGAQLVAADEHVDGRGKLGQVCCLLGGRVAAANHRERLVAEER